ncbi:erythromycin esterase family protein [Alkalicoccus saliphilus]|uniref:Erythromycin esterase n=1 Tax=Alkalicoccus saliphilus TaxID=200989 RepID=A0A2T4U3W1_9BACI|nr:erythromycin esterase family protein [Alkalicoccus saliphilus]PTL38076.1 hypothetical protein C6Y45_13310 [Alkalicoccus saliphilus]
MNKKEEQVQQIIEETVEINGPSGYAVLDEYVNNKSIVLLGESSHGMSEYFTDKIGLIRYLHEKHDFNMLALENSFMETALSEPFYKDKSIQERLQDCFLDIYHTKEMQPLFTEAWTESLTVAGIDPQPAYTPLSEMLRDWMETSVDEETAEAFHHCEKLFFEIDDVIRQSGRASKQLKDRMGQVAERYEVMQKLVEKQKDQIEKENLPEMYTLLSRGIENRIHWLRLSQKKALSSGVDRSFRMFENLKWLKETHKPGAKIIVWAHNFHVRKNQPAAAKLLGVKSLGHWVEEHYGKESLTVGYYAGSGTYASQLREEKTVKIPGGRHMEAALMKKGGEKLFLPVRKDETSSWQRTKWRFLESGITELGPETLKPESAYDALMFIRHVQAPDYFEQ